MQRMRWEYFLPLVDFAYNNGYQEALKMSPLKALYGGKFNTLINWNDPMNKVHIKPNMLEEME